LRGLICLCVFRVSYICCLLRVSGTFLAVGVLCLDLHWLGYMGLGVAVLFVASFYYVLLRGFGVLPLLSHVSLVLLFIVYTLLFLVGDFSLAVVYYNSHSGLP
jgi:cytochrome c biogenesis factor